MKENIKILLVDDDPSDRIEFVNNLENIGYSGIRVAVNGQEAIDFSRDFQPHLILMDTNMFGIDGCEACRQIRQEEYGKNVAIIGMSGGSCENEWLDAGADDFLDKYVVSSDKITLDETIQKALKRYQL